jgi:hypothetical protein
MNTPKGITESIKVQKTMKHDLAETVEFPKTVYPRSLSSEVFRKQLFGNQSIDDE